MHILGFGHTADDHAFSATLEAELDLLQHSGILVSHFGGTGQGAAGISDFIFVLGVALAKSNHNSIGRTSVRYFIGKIRVKL